MEVKLLIVEDDLLISEAASDYFSSKGWDVETAGDGFKALELVKRRSFHLILLDIMMPGMDLPYAGKYAKTATYRSSLLPPVYWRRIS